MPASPDKKAPPSVMLGRSMLLGKRQMKNEKTRS